MKLDVRAIRGLAENDFEKAWIETAALLPRKGQLQLKKKRGEPSQMRELAQKIRETLLSLGFDEVENRHVLEEAEVYKQYGPESPVILDRCYYLAMLPRPELGIGKEKEEIIRGIDAGFGGEKKEKLAEILRKYKSGDLEGDDFVDAMVQALNWKEEQATAVMEKAFPELRALKPIASNLVLRSHMTAVWFETLAALQDKREQPIALFALGPRFRNEQKEDAGHLRVHHGASIVIMGETVTVEAGNRIAAEIFEKLGFKKPEFELKAATSKYYAPKSEFEVFAEWKGKTLEIADSGMYSPVALANYGIKYPVYNIGFGLERMAMILYGYDDIRELVYPQFYAKLALTDEQIAASVRIALEPKTEEGKTLAKTLYDKTAKEKDHETPFTFTAYSGKFLGKNITLDVFKDEAGKRLLGPAGMNRVFAYDGGIVAFAPEKLSAEVRENGVDTGIDFLKAMSASVARKVEEAVASGGTGFEFVFPMAKGPSDVNVAIPEHVYRFITSKNKKIDFRGPIFFGVRLKIG